MVQSKESADQAYEDFKSWLHGYGPADIMN
jgi:hypothetical protein